MSISETKDLSDPHSAEKNREIMRFHCLRLRVIAAFVTDLDTSVRSYSNRTVVSASMRRP